MKILGIKNDTSVSERHKVTSDCVRFSQKKSIFFQPEWNPVYTGLAKKDYAKSRINKINKGTPGFSVLDWAYYRGATANTNATDFLINRPNSGGNSWSEIKRVGFGSEEVSVEQWKGTSEAGSTVVKKMALLSGADDVGICELNRNWVYSHYYDPVKNEEYPIRFSDEAGYEHIDKPLTLPDGTQVIPSGMKNVIVFIHEMDYEGIQNAPTLTHMATTQMAYSNISFTTMAVAEFIRSLGYNAIPSSNCTALNIPLAIDAGLGELSRQNKLIHPVFGPRCRISKVITDLPLDYDIPVSFGVKEFCSTCLRCAKGCVAGAIPEGEPTYEPLGDYSNKGVFRWQMDHAACRDFWVKMGTNCGICIKVCPYNKPRGLSSWLMKSAAAVSKRFKPAVSFLEKIQKKTKRIKSEEFWNI
jgi:reductive dehalogenase